MATSEPASGGMPPEAVERFLARPVIARLATVFDGQPRVLPMWFSWDGRAVWMETNPDFPNARILRANPRAALTIDETLGGLRFRAVIMRGSIEVIDGPGRLIRQTVERIYRKYLGADLAHPDAQRMLNAPHVVLKFVPSRITGWDDTASEVAGRPDESGS